MLRTMANISRTSQNAVAGPQDDPDDLVAELTNLLLQKPAKQAEDPIGHDWSAWEAVCGPPADSWEDSPNNETAKHGGLIKDGNVEMSEEERQKYKQLIDLFPDIPSASLAKALLKADGDIAVAAQLLIGEDSSPPESNSLDSKSWEETEDTDAFAYKDFTPVHAKRGRPRGGSNFGGAKRKLQQPQEATKWTPGRISDSMEPSREAPSLEPERFEEFAPHNPLEEETEEAVRFLVDIIDNPDIGSGTIRDILGQYKGDILQALACLEMLVGPPPSRAGERGGSAEEDLGLQHLLQAFPDHDPAAVVMAYQTSNLDVTASASQLIISEEQESSYEMPSPPTAQFQEDLQDLVCFFPTIGPPVLSSLLRAMNGNVGETRKMLLESRAGPPQSPPAVRYNNPAPPAWGGAQPSIPDGRGGSGRWTREAQVYPKGPPPPPPPPRQGRQVSSCDSEYSAARKKSNESHYQMKWHFDRAAEAYTRGDKEYAACMSMKGKEHRQRMQELNGEAAQKLAQSNARKRGSHLELDLHMMHVIEAVAETQKTVRTLCQIPRRGRHSAGGQPRVKPAIISYLTEEQIPFKQDPRNEGIIVVYLDALRNPAPSKSRPQYLSQYIP